MDNPSEYKPIVQYYAVLYYDVLGQSGKLHQIKNLPSNPHEGETLLEALKATAGTILTLRQHLNKFYAGVAKSRIDPLSLPPEHRPLFAEARKLDLAIRNFSDLTVVHVPLMETNELKLPITSVGALISSAALMMMMSLASKSPIRGAIDVGLAVNLLGDEIYGPILDCVYENESMNAQWPRILVGDGLLSYLDECISKDEGSPTHGIRRREAEKWKQWIVVDVDGKYAIDYLGAAVKKDMGSKVDPAFIRRIVDFVQSEYDRFKKNGPEKLEHRYEKVLSYCEDKKDIWL